MFGLISFFIATLSSLIYFYLSFLKRSDIPTHLLNHTAEWIPNFLSEEDFNSLNQIVKEMKDFPTNVDADLKTGGFKVRYEHIGEAEEISNDGKCKHSYLVPNPSRTHCILPQRVDVGRHFITTGGPDAIRESFDKMISRVSSFGRYMFQVVDKYPTMQKLFAQDSFQAAAKRICPKDQQYLDPFQFNFIIQVPGQTVATHLDGVYFWGATRKEFPQWLLACMAFSNLFQDKFIHQVQVVGYLHSWSPEDILHKTGGTGSIGGDFVYYNRNDPVPDIITPLPRSGALVDGSKTVHAANVYLPNIEAPVLDKNKANTLTYLGNEKWGLSIDGNITQTYDNKDLRIAIVYRARCFKDNEQKNHFYNLPENEIMTLDYVLETLINGMVERSPGR